jgi:hypothetical protein
MITVATCQTTYFIFVFEKFDADCAIVACSSEKFVWDRGVMVLLVIWIH